MDPQGFVPGSGMTSGVDPGPHGSDTTTCVRTEAGEARVRVRVRPGFLPERSDPRQPMYVFGYQVTVEYQAPAEAPPAQLVARRWRIIDAHGSEGVVQGEGLLGQQPVLRPGEQFSYDSYCPLRTSWGTMEGQYGLVLLDGHRGPSEGHTVRIGRFYLISDASRS